MVPPCRLREKRGREVQWLVGLVSRGRPYNLTEWRPIDAAWMSTEAASRLTMVVVVNIKHGQCLTVCLTAWQLRG